MDTVPYIRPAGVSTGNDSRSTAQCVQPDLEPSNQSQPALTGTLTDKYRKSYQLQTGLKFIHPALSSDGASVRDGHVYGVETKQSLTVNDVLKAGTNGDRLVPDSLQSFINTHKEAIYRTNRIAPIGQSYKRGFALPAGDIHTYGVTTQTSESAKSLLYTHANVGTDGACSDRVPMSQVGRAAETLVTKPYQRHYNWSSPSIDPVTHTFGLTNTNVDPSGKNVSDALRHHSEEKETVIVNNRVANHQLHSHYPVGATKPLREAKLIELVNDSEFKFGKASESDSVTVREVLKGSYTLEEQMPDKDLGVSKHRASHSATAANTEADGASDRMFGVPTIRTDRSVPANRSLTNQCNFGDEGSSHSLLFPSPYAMNGINDEDFMRVRSPEYIERIFARMGVKFKSHQFATLCRMAAQYYGTLSLDSFRHVYNRSMLENRCSVCYALLCCHSDCVDRPCKHDGENGHGNHRPFLTHQRVVKPLNAPALSSAGTATAMLNDTVPFGRSKSR